jgi:molecular chaperone GrpE
MAADDNDDNETTSGTPAQEPKEDKAARMNSAKAFYRAMYAGAEPDPEEFGIDLGGKEKGNDAASQAAVLHLEGQLKESEARATEWENLYKRMQADFDNYRKRMDRERDEMQSIGMQKALEAILPALDDLDMAQSKLTENTESKVMLQSFKMIYARFTRCLEIIGIKQMQVIGEPFDPRLHEPIQEIHTAEFPEGAVVQQLRPGYLFGERVLRPTLVNVATSPLDGPGYQPPAEKAAAPEADAAAQSPATAVQDAAAQSETSDVLPVIDLQNNLETPADQAASTSDSVPAAEDAAKSEES